MKIIPAGKFESALVRLVDEVLNPNRNMTGHEYYMDLNRVVDRSYVEGVGTFIALANDTLVPFELDWSDLDNSKGNERIELGVHKTERPDRSNEEDNTLHEKLSELAEQICDRQILSIKSLEYVTSLDLATYLMPTVRHGTSIDTRSL